jgi:1-acyl-sn-glycerol-3-phosphate acyltransferase
MVLAVIKFLIILIAAIPLSIIALVSTPIDRSGRTFHAMSRYWAKIILWLFGIKVRTRGTENIEPEKRYVYISNHASMFDIPAVVTGIPDEIGRAHV